jgi:hypothetical protein
LANTSSREAAADEAPRKDTLARDLYCPLKLLKSIFNPMIYVQLPSRLVFDKGGDKTNKKFSASQLTSRTWKKDKPLEFLKYSAFVSV